MPTHSGFKQLLIKIILGNRYLRVLAHLREHIRKYPGGLNRGLAMIRQQGFKAFWKRIKLLAQFGGVDNKAPDSIDAKKEYHYREPEYDALVEQTLSDFEQNPLFSIIIPVYNVEPQWLEKAIKSVKKQWYVNWEICLVDDASDNSELKKYLESLEADKLILKELENNVNIAEASNIAVKLSGGDYIVLLDHDDELTADALFEAVKCINQTDADFIYSDEDKISILGEYCEPHYKADYSPFMLWSQNYICHLSVIKKSLIERAGYFTSGLDGAQDYDLFLRISELTDKIAHIPKVLYHWRKIPGSTAAEFGYKSYAHLAGLKALENMIIRRNFPAKAENGKHPGTYRLRFEIKDSPLISIIIPFKDKPELLKLCVSSLVANTDYTNYEIIAISNNSVEKETFAVIEALKAQYPQISCYEYNQPFNYSQINNYAVQNHAAGDYLVFLNNDIEIITSGWLEEMLSFAQLEMIGAVGSKLYYPDNTIQHAGVILGIGGVAGHSHKYFDKEEAGYFARLDIIQNVSAVTAACLMVKKFIFEQVGRFDENNLAVAFNDIDFCLRVREKGYLNLYTPYCEAYHHESVTRGAEDDEQKIQRFNREIAYMQKRHGKLLKNDPYYNINLSLTHEDFRLK